MKYTKVVGILVLLCWALVVAQDERRARVDCEPEGQADQVLCEQRGCIYDEVLDEPGVPWCFFPDNYGYSLEAPPSYLPTGILGNLVRNQGIGSFVGNDFDNLMFEVQYQTNERLRIRITPAEQSRFEVPITISTTGLPPTNPLYNVQVNQGQNGFNIKVERRATGSILFDTEVPGFIYSDQFIQIGTKLSSTNLYGLGENEQHSYKHDMNWKTWAGYARDQPPSGDANMYGVHPTYTVVEPDGNAHTVLFLNSAAQEWTTTPNPSLIYKTISGILDIYIFLGPSPDEANQQYSEAVGRYNLPPYWSLGFHLSRYGYGDLDTLQATIGRMEQYSIPQDAQWGDIDIMDRQLDFTIDPVNFAQLPSYVQELKAKNIRFVTILDPCISTGEGSSYRPYELGNAMDVWVKKQDGNPVVGRVWPEDAIYFADYSKAETKEWWRILIEEFHDLIEFDALWIDMNEPANFLAGDEVDGGCAGNNINYPPYKTRAWGDELADKTICGDHVQDFGLHYDTHNLYGWSESDATLWGVQNATGLRGWVLSRSTFIGSGKWVAHWLGDNFSNWNNLFYSIIGMLQFNRFAIPHVGADICGYIDNTTAELCARWQQLGAFYPFSRNHNGFGYIEQDPGVFGDTVAKITRESLNVRYRFLPYLYTLFFKHFTIGSSVARALWDEFPTNSETWSIDKQFMWGSGLMISPVVEQGAVTKEVYFPNARWFEITYWLTQDIITEVLGVNDYQRLDAPLEVLPIHVRGGTIFPLQFEALNTVLARRNDWQLLIALDESEEASGDLFMDDGISMDTVAQGFYFEASFVASGGTVQSQVLTNGYPAINNEVIASFEIVGIKSVANVNQVLINGEVVTSFSFDQGRLSVSNVSVKLAESFTLLYI